MSSQCREMEHFQQKSTFVAASSVGAWVVRDINKNIIYHVVSTFCCLEERRAARGRLVEDINELEKRILGMKVAAKDYNV